jgi:hypothetical protein
MNERVTLAAAAIANCRGGRRGAPAVSNILAILRSSGLGDLYDEVMEDAEAAMKAVGWQPIERAPRDGSAILGYGRHIGSPPDAQRGVVAGDHWWAIMLWDIWRPSHTAGWHDSRWVFAKDGKTTWTEPTHWMQLPYPPD